jgi:GT2 family glycosyltransferase
MSKKNKPRSMTRIDKGRMFLKHCSEHPLDVLRLSKATILYGTEGVKARADELARKEWEKRIGTPKSKVQKIEHSVKFSIIMPVYNVEVKWLDKALESIKKQTYKRWEVCIADDASTDFRVQEYLKKINDKRVKIKFLEENQGISGASNEAASMATGDYILLMDNDDELHPDALYDFYRDIMKTKADILYSDMDMIDTEGNHSSPLFKPDWSPDLFLSQMYLGHLVGFKRELFEVCRGFRSEYDGAQDYDLILRMSEFARNISHIPKVLYSWRILPTSTATNADSKPYAQTAGQRAIQAHLDRKLGEGVATVEETENLFVYDVRYKINKKPFVSIIIPTKDHVEDLRAAVDSIFSKTVYDGYEIIILDNNSEKKETMDYFNAIQIKYNNVRVEEAKYEFNWSKLNNQGIQSAEGDVFVFLNNDIEVLEPSWLQRLVEHAVQPDTGVVGGLLLYEDGTIQHAGVVIGIGGWADHVYKGMKPIHHGSPYISPMVARNVTACTGACMAISRRVIEKIGRFDERFIICGSDVEICIRALDEGYKNVYIPQIKLRHYESKSRDSFIPKIDFKLSDIMYSGYRKGGDPYYNINLSTDTCIPQVVEEKKLDSVKGKILDVEIGSIREIHFKKEQREKYRLNLVLPSLNEEHVFGGIATALRCFEALADEVKCDTRIILIDAKLNKKAVKKYGERYQIISAKEKSNAAHQIVPMVQRENKRLFVSECDQFMFTSWWSAYIIQNAYREWNEREEVTPKPFLYLIQDYEPGFYPWSSGYMLADSTYRCDYPQIAIFNSHELKEYMLAKGYKFTSVYCFEPILNSVLKKHVCLLEDTVFKRKQILIYGRPGVSRNAFEIVVEALRKWVAMQPGANSWTILSAGEQHDPVYLGEGIYLNSVGKLTLEEYAKVLEESYAGISLMVSPHPSYPPLEMSVFDVQVITNSYGNKNISDFSENIISLDNTNPVQIAYELKRICDRYHTVVPHKNVNQDYVNAKEPFAFIKDLKIELMREIN